MEVIGRDALKTFSGMGVGLSIMNEYYVSEEEKKKLFIKNVTKFFGNAETGIVVRKGKKLSHPAEVFIDLVRKSIKEK